MGLTFRSKIVDTFKDENLKPCNLHDWDSEFIDELISFIKENLPPAHELQSHELYPGIKLSGKPVFIVDDDTTGKRLMIDFINRKRWEKANLKVPTIRLFKNNAEIQEMIEQDHQTEFSQYHIRADTNL